MPESTTPQDFTFRPTSRSFAFLAVAVILFFTIVEKKSDILASILVVAVAAILLGLLLYSFISAKRLSKKSVFKAGLVTTKD